MSTDFPPALPHREIVEVFPDIFQVTGVMAMRGARFSRNMTIVRQDGDLTLINTVRLDDDGLKALDELGAVKNVIRLGFFHDRDDPFYMDRYQGQARFWSVPDCEHGLGLQPDEILSPDSELPLAGASVFLLETAARPEAILRLDRDGGILISCDCLQNWARPTAEFNFMAKLMMRVMGFFKPTNVGPGWIRLAKPGAADFERLNQLEYEHVLPSHGTPVKGDARNAYGATFQRLFGVDPPG